MGEHDFDGDFRLSILQLKALIEEAKGNHKASLDIHKVYMAERVSRSEQSLYDDRKAAAERLGGALEFITDHAVGTEVIVTLPVKSVVKGAAAASALVA